MTERPERRAVGRIVKAHGVRGELVVQSRTDSPRQRFAPGAVLDARLRDGTERSLTVNAAREHSGRLLVAFAGVGDRDAAESLRGALLLVDPTTLARPEDPDEFYDHELEGLLVVTTAGRQVGTVREVVHGPAGDILAVDRAGGGDEVLVPFVREIVPEIDLAAGRILIEPPEGLIDPVVESP